MINLQSSNHLAQLNNSSKILFKFNHKSLRLQRLKARKLLSLIFLMKLIQKNQE